MHASEVTPEAAERANDLYWHSDQSVNQIADALDLSKGALYGVLESVPVGLGCPLCGDEVAHPNRTARERGTVECDGCGWDGSRDETIPYSPDHHDPDAAAMDSALPADPHEPTPAVMRAETTPPPPLILPSPGTIAAGALLGGAVGLALVLWARRR